jgi:uncharacterized protein (UPF0332 family)
MTRDLNEYISYRIARAYETLDDGKKLAETQSWNSCVNRLYYACFYAVSALLLSNGFETKTHNGVKTIFFKEFIATKLIPREFANLYADLLDWRNEADYADFIDYDKKTVDPVINKVEIFLENIKSRID